MTTVLTKIILSRDTPLSVPPRDESSYKPFSTFTLDQQRSYKQQYGDMYFLRLTKIKPAVEQVAAASWDGTTIGGETATKVDRVLDVRQGELCWVAGTVYMDMSLKPNILEDVSKDVSCALVNKSWPLTDPFRSAGYPHPSRRRNTTRTTAATRSPSKTIRAASGSSVTF